MSKPTQTTRERIVAAADELFYQRGFEHTSFTDIAQAVNLSRGNFYHHFKTKDDILEAVIAYRLSNTQAMLAAWETNSQDPESRINHFIHILIMNQAKIKQFGCPVGTLCTELAKLNHALHTQANAIFTLFKGWLQSQFIRMGYEAKANTLAMHLLGRSQGIALLANTFKDETFIEHEVAQLRRWLSTLKKSAIHTDDNTLRGH